MQKKAWIAWITWKHVAITAVTLSWCQAEYQVPWIGEIKKPEIYDRIMPSHSPDNI